GVSRLADGKANSVLQPLAAGIIANGYSKHRWQAGQKRAAELRIAGHISADDSGHFAAASGTGQLQALRENFTEPEFEVDGLRGAVSKDMGIAVWEDHDVARTYLDRVTAFDAGDTPPFRQQVVNDHMSAAWRKMRRNDFRARLAETPGRCEFGV